MVVDYYLKKKLRLVITFNLFKFNIKNGVKKNYKYL